MGKAPIAATLVVIFSTIVAFVYSFSFLFTADSDNETTVKNIARNAMTEAVNQGNLRVNEEITINEEVAVEAAVRMYAASSDFSKGDRYLNIAEVSSNPPMLAIDSYVEIMTPLKSVVNRFSSKNEILKPNITRSREVIIYEAKSTAK